MSLFLHALQQIILHNRYVGVIITIHIILLRKDCSALLGKLVLGIYLSYIVKLVFAYTFCMSFFTVTAK